MAVDIIARGMAGSAAANVDNLQTQVDNIEAEIGDINSALDTINGEVI